MSVTAARIVVSACVLGWSSVATAQEEAGTRLGARVSAGVEYDDNVLRTTLTDAPPRSDGLSRYFASVDVGHRHDALTTMIQLRQGGKLFWAERDADALLTQATLAARYKLDDVWSLGATLDIKDRTERLSVLDYTRGGATMELSAAWQRLELSAGGGWRMFAFKPSPSASTDGLAAQASARLSIVEGVSAQAAYGLTLRDFTTGRFVRDMPRPGEQQDRLRLLQDSAPRRDQFHSVSIGAQWQGPVVLELTYQYANNKSNSYGQGLQRHSGDVTLTAPLVWELYLSANVGLQRTLYDDPVLVDANFQVDEENRNQAVLALQRPLGELWDVELRYSLFGQEFGGGGDYGRQTLMFALGFTYD